MADRRAVMAEGVSHATRAIRRLAFVSVFVLPLHLGAQEKPVMHSVVLDRIVAIVGRKPITLTELYAHINDEIAMRQARNMPPLSGDSLTIMRTMLDDMIDTELLLQKAAEWKLEPNEEEVARPVDAQIKRARANMSEAEILKSLKEQGVNSVEEFRKQMLERSRKEKLQRMILDTLGKLGQMPTVSVSERDIMTAFDSLKKNSEPRGPVVTFRQIVIKPVPSDSSENRAKALADSLLAAIKAGAPFDSLAMKFSDDSSNAKEGGDLGWQSRGRFVREFDQVVFSLPIGQVSNVVKTQFGYHIIKVDRIRPGEVRSRHILIVPRMDARDVTRAKLKAEKIAEALKAGANYDSLADKNHDPGERPVLHSRKVSIALAELPEEYANALRPTKKDSVTPVFDVVMPDGSPTKAAVAQVLERNESGEYTLAEVRERLRSQLSQAGSWRRLIDNLRKQTYVSVRLDSALRTGKTSQ